MQDSALSLDRRRESRQLRTSQYTVGAGGEHARLFTIDSLASTSADFTRAHAEFV